MRNLYDRKTNRMKKLRHHVSFPIEIEESDLCIGLDYRVSLSPDRFRKKKSQVSVTSLSQSEECNENKENEEDKSSDRIDIDQQVKPSSPSPSSSSISIDYIYQLKAVIVHHGGPDSGL